MENNAVSLPEARQIALEGVRNFRDLGGYPALDGRHVRWGQLFRSGSLGGLTPAGWDKLSAHGIRTICDFRTDSERAAEPFPWADQACLSYWARDYKVSFAVLGDTLRSGFATGEAAREGMIAGYRELPFQQAPAYRQLFTYLKAGDVPLVFNCAAGKDRAGTAAALILTALGVPREVVVEDYTLTNQIYDVGTTPRNGHLANYPEEVGGAIARADPAYINAALDAISQRCGSIELFLGELMDVDANGLRSIRDRLLV